MAIIKYVFLMGVPFACTWGLWTLLQASESQLEASGEFAFLTDVKVQVAGAAAAYIILLYVSYEIYKRLEINTEVKRLLRPFRRDLNELREIIEDHQRRQLRVKSIVGRYAYKASYEESGVPKESEGDLQIHYDDETGLHIRGTDHSQIGFQSEHVSISSRRLYFHWTVPVGPEGGAVMGMASLGLDDPIDGRVRKLSGVWGSMGGEVGQVTYTRIS